MDVTYLMIPVLAFLVVIVFPYIRRGSRVRPLVIQSPSRLEPLVINSPRLGMLNLKGSGASRMVTEDRSAIQGLFSSVDESTSTPPRSDVLFLYCDFGSDGHIAGTARSLRDIVRDSGAHVVIVASENSGKSCGAAAKPAGHGRADLVLILARKGDAFASFYRSLFGDMARGVPMPVAWVRLAPQIPGLVQVNCPDALFICEAGQITFGYPPSPES